MKWWISAIASCARRFGRNPYEHDWKSASKMGSNTSFKAACTTRSVTVGMPNARSFPLALGIITCRTGTGWNARDFNFSRTPRRKASTPTRDVIHATVTRSTPGVRDPLFPATRCHATIRNAGSQTRLYRSSNRRSPSVTAQQCSLVCILRTTTAAVLTSGHPVAPVFTDASSDITVPPLLPSTAALPHVPGSPRLGVLRRLRPTRALQRATRLSPRGERDTGGSHVHCCSVDG